MAILKNPVYMENSYLDLEINSGIQELPFAFVGLPVVNPYMDCYLRQWLNESYDHFRCTC